MRAAELIMFWKPGCPWCQAWEREVGEAYPKTDEGRTAPLRRHLITDPKPADIRFDAPLRYTPTFVLVQDGEEVGRITGYPGNANFWGLLGRLLERLPESARAPSG